MLFVYAIIDMLLDQNLDLPFGWTIHSRNPVGSENLSGLLTSYGRRHRDSNATHQPEITR